MNESNALIILQTISLTASVCMALMLGLSRIHIRNKNENYEKVRWMLFSVAMLMAVHYWSQIHFGFRAMGDDVGALVNILFYTPIAYILSYSIIRMACGKKYMKRYLAVAIVSISIIVGLIVIGYIVYQSPHMQHAIYCMGVVFFVTMLVFIIEPSNRIKQMRKKVEAETADDLQNYNLYMSMGTRIISLLSALLPIAIFSKYMLGIFGPIFMVALFFYMLCFVAMGFNNSQIDIVEDDDKTDDGAVDTEDGELSEEQLAAIDEKVDRWEIMRGYCNPDLNIKTMANQLGIDKKQLSEYLLKRKGLTFRIWLSDLRIEEVKKMLSEEKDFTTETIASECGFSSRSWMHQRFKEVTGMTPKEWKGSK